MRVLVQPYGVHGSTDISELDRSGSCDPVFHGVSLFRAVHRGGLGTNYYFEVRKLKKTHTHLGSNYFVNALLFTNAIFVLQAHS